MAPPFLLFDYDFLNSLMKYPLLAPALLLHAACQSNTSIDVTASEADHLAKAQPEVASASPEHIELSMLTINSKPHMKLSTEVLTKQMGRPDSIAKGVVECGGELEPVNNANGDYWYYGKTSYEVGGTQAVLAGFDVTTGKFQGKLGRLELNQNTTLEDVRRFYPEAAKEADAPASGRPGRYCACPSIRMGHRRTQPWI
ncbi:hypothetical protein LJY25_03055 [Hymenobacter sp. BT175]|uniref:hypothetical protein n=1 Tax=Hymenobacter translucens TaxID=2886507 RepID=UPI001D0E9993|nr:hypothetical protein [Hymenobacter translucens]MCC2545410.1 hypothetical protein [Hymenobacter translucens]